jgi:hypothetical protein
MAHGAAIAPEQLQQAREALASQVAEVPFAFAAAVSVTEQRFGFMFPRRQNPANRLPTSAATVRRLKALGRTMVEDREGAVGDAATLAALYTYFGQFVDHDITLETSSFKPEELVADDLSVLSLADIGTLTNLRSAGLELDSVYGPGALRSGAKLTIGKVTSLHGTEFPNKRPPGRDDFNDLPRLGPNTSDPAKDRAARIGDARNDENLIISQLHLAFLKAHNRLVDQGKSFAQAQQLLRQHYQHIVLFDFLQRRIADPAVVDDVLTNGNRFYHPEVEPFFLPLEFTVAGFRFGHSMVRSEYDYNLNFNPGGRPGTIPATLDLLFTFTALSGQLGEHRTLPDNWIIQWRKFLAPGGKNRARKLDTTITRELFHLRDLEGNEEGKPQLGEKNDQANLAVRNLLRGYALRMPTGQAVADEMGFPALTPNQLLTVARQSRNRNQAKALEDGRFLERTPLWYYLLAEAKHHHDGDRLGPVASRIVAEVLVGLVQRSEHSILRDPDWKPTMPQANPQVFVLADLLRFAKVA